MARFNCLIWLTCLFLNWTSCNALAAGKAYTSPEEATQKDPDFVRQGEYVGDKVGVQVIALGHGKFRAVSYTGGLPGQGWDGGEKKTQEGTWDEIKSVVEGLKKVDRVSPTLGASVPAGGVVLFDGTEDTLKTHWKDGARMTSDGLLQEGVTSIDTFGDFTLHLEFRLPYMPESSGQARGNSGCYLQGRYEVQMLDSFGLEGKGNECGGIYKAAAPSVNMCFPPLAWQTYDIDFTAARFDQEGKKISNARATVKHNGVVIHDNLEIPTATPGGPLNNESADPGPIFLQNHGDPVRYRNIWVVPK